MKNKDTKEAFVQLKIANSTFAKLAECLKGNDELKAYFAKVHKEFGALLEEGNIKKINNYMENAYPLFIKYLGCSKQ